MTVGSPWTLPFRPSFTYSNLPSFIRVADFNGMAIEARIWKDRGVSDAIIPIL